MCFKSDGCDADLYDLGFVIDVTLCQDCALVVGMKKCRKGEHGLSAGGCVFMT